MRVVCTQSSGGTCFKHACGGLLADSRSSQLLQVRLQYTLPKAHLPFPLRVPTAMTHTCASYSSCSSVSVCCGGAPELRSRGQALVQLRRCPAVYTQTAAPTRMPLHRCPGSLQNEPHRRTPDHIRCPMQTKLRCFSSAHVAQLKGRLAPVPSQP